MAAAPVFAAQVYVQPLATISAETDSNLDLQPASQGSVRTVEGYIVDAAALIGIATPNSSTTIRPRIDYRNYPADSADDRLEEALDFIKKAVDLDPANGAYLDSLGWAYFKLGKYEMAEDSLIKASQRIGTDPTVQDHLGDLYQKTGRLKLAATHWEQALTEWNRTVAAEVDQNDVSRVQKKLESAKMKLAKESSENK